LKPYAILMANEHLESLRAEAAAYRATKVEGPSLLERIKSAIEEGRRHAETVYAMSSFLPKLQDYPYRG
jgi:hypothetical protein